MVFRGGDISRREKAIIVHEVFPDFWLRVSGTPAGVNFQTPSLSDRTRGNFYNNKPDCSRVKLPPESGSGA
jgi:hypothetical protein